MHEHEASSDRLETAPESPARVSCVLADDFPRMSSVCTYVVAADNGEVKVGMSRTPYSRLSHIKRDYGPRRRFKNACLVGIIWTYAAMEVESEVIRLLVARGQAVGGEWFRCSPDEAVRLVIEEAEAWQGHPSVVLPETPAWLSPTPSAPATAPP